jgi:hypothetical protein
MPSSKLLIGGAAATTALGLRVALYNRWHVLPQPQRHRIESLAQDLKHKALDLRGAPDVERARADLHTANERLAAALVESADADPEVSDDEVLALRAELRRELERLSTADIKASTAQRESDTPPR